MDMNEWAAYDYDPAENILAVRYPRGLLLDSEAMIESLCAYALQQVQAIGHPVYVLVDETGVRFDLRLVDHYNRAFAPCRPYVLATTRYGQVDSWMHTMISLRAQEEQAGTNIYPTRERALAALRKIIAADRAAPSGP
jgi:hypothetical protein